MDRVLACKICLVAGLSIADELHILSLYDVLELLLPVRRHTVPAHNLSDYEQSDRAARVAPRSAAPRAPAWRGYCGLNVDSAPNRR